ncbi:hypothetical protein OO184_10670 [Photorhabdus sp. APURE]|uniref:hypothetical protein n=1 Tax=Photorhabdus aballayi TaxID=2991723 RepID=UPI00223CFE48|nr:hypothetical protein [Photorhabdus aballayi]MCW7548391.1 hypothetical protein [Photorhabdus aballayi]
MTSRKDIENGRLIYTEDLGWIDLGHAKGDDSKMLWNKLITEGNDSPYKKGYFLVYYFQEMSKYTLWISRCIAPLPSRCILKSIGYSN